MTQNANVTVLFIGDICLSGSSAAAWSLNQRAGLFEAWPLGEGDDWLTVGNVEGPFTSQTVPVSGKYATFRADPVLLPKLKGLDVALLANNHINDYGLEGADETIRGLQKLGIAHVGYGRLSVPATTTLILYHHGLTLGFINMCCPTSNPPLLAAHREPGVVPLSLGLLKAEIDKYRGETDALFFCPHWGQEMRSQPVPEQVWIAHQAIDWGIDAVIGHHAHVIQPHETYRGRHIYYGLGNYIYPDGGWTATTAGGDVLPKMYSLSDKERTSLGVMLEISSIRQVNRVREKHLVLLSCGDNYLPCRLAQTNAMRAVPRLSRVVRTWSKWLRSPNHFGGEAYYLAAWSQGRMRFWYRSSLSLFNQSLTRGFSALRRTFRNVRSPP